MLETLCAIAGIHEAVDVSQTQGMKSLVIVIHDEGMPPALPMDNDKR